MDSNKIFNAAVADSEIGAQVVELAKASVPGQAKRAVLTKEQRTWVTNRIRQKYLPNLSDQEQKYYMNLPKDVDPKDVKVQARPLLLEVLGGSASSSTTGPAPTKPLPIPPRQPSGVGKTRPSEDKSKTQNPPKRPLSNKRDCSKTVAQCLLKHGRGSRAGVCKLVRKVVALLDNECPGVQQELLRDEPITDNLLLQSLSRLREEAVNAGFQTVAIADLDYTLSAEGTWSRRFLQKQGYRLGQAAWKSVLKRTKQNVKLDRRKREMHTKGGRPSKVNPDFIEVTRQVLAQHSKPGSQLAHVHRHSDGTFGHHKPRGSQEDARVVPAQSLLTKTARMWQDHPEIHNRVSKSMFYKVLKRHFADFRPGHRKTDICSHCQCFWNHLVPRFHRDWKRIRDDLLSVYPGYFAHYPVDRIFSDVGEEAEFAWKYVNSHAEKYKEERNASGCDRLQLYSFTEAPAGVLLKGHVSLLRSYLWHMLTARRQENCLKQLMTPEKLPQGDTLLIFDWKEKIRLPVGPEETSDMWHCQQKYAISCFGCCCFRHTSFSSPTTPALEQLEHASGQII